MLGAALIAALLGGVPDYAKYDRPKPRFVDRRCSRTEGGRSKRGLDCGGAFFELAPASGAGMGSACACAAVTGAKGEAVTFARASTGTCTKPGLALTGIVSNDLATCASGQARVERMADGTLGLLVEESRVNSLLRSQRLDNGAWVNFIGTGGTNPVVTADQGTAPDPSPTSQPEQVVFAATTGAQASMLAQAALSVAAYSAGVYAQYVSGTCNLDLCIETNATGPVATCTSTSVSSSTTWARLKNENVTSVATGRVFIGNGSAINGGSARSACTVLLWQADGQAGPFITSPIYTDVATATRASETASVAVATPATAESIAVTIQAPVYTASPGFLGVMRAGAANHAFYAPSGGGYATINNGGSLVNSGYTLNGTQARAWSSWDGTTLVVNYAGNQNSATPVFTMLAGDTVVLGGPISGFANPSSALIAGVCVDPSIGRCR